MSETTRRFPVFIVSKGRAFNPLTARCFLEQGVPFRILVEPQEVDEYAAALGADVVVALPFSNLGLGSYPARNYAWTLASQEGAEYHWTFDDNIRRFYIQQAGDRVRLVAPKALEIVERFVTKYENLDVAAMLYYNQCYPGSVYTQRPYTLNAHCYSAMLIKTAQAPRWRMKYNEDVDLCLQVLHGGRCTALITAVLADKMSTVAKMSGGNQDELYKGNAPEKKIKKAADLVAVWPQYAKIVERYQRPHHYVDWSMFKQPLIRKAAKAQGERVALMLRKTPKKPRS